MFLHLHHLDLIIKKIDTDMTMTREMKSKFELFAKYIFFPIFSFLKMLNTRHYKNRTLLTFLHWPHLIFTKFSESRMMFETTLTLFSSDRIMDLLSSPPEEETAIEVLFREGIWWFVRWLEVSRCSGNGIWIECPCCSFGWSFWNVCDDVACV